MKIIVVTIIVILCAFLFLRDSGCNIIRLGEIEQNKRYSKIDARNNKVILATLYAPGFIKAESIYHTMSSSTGYVSAVQDNALTKLFKFKGGKVRSIEITAKGEIYCLLGIYNRDDSITSKIVRISENVIEIANFDKNMKGIAVADNDGLYVWNEEHVYRVNPVTKKVTQFPGTYSIDYISFSPVSDSSGSLHFFSGNKYLKIEKGVVHSKLITYEKPIQAMCVDGFEPFVLVGSKNNFKVIQVDTGKEVALLKEEGLPVLMYKNGKEIIIVLSNIGLITTTKTVYHSFNEGKSWKKKSKSINEIIADDKGELYAVTHQNEIIRIDCRKGKGVR